MIFTKCSNPNCDEPIVLCWECGNGYGFSREVCEKCNSVSFVECTSLGDGETLSEKDFWEKYPDAIAPEKN